jgi:hypothetical protein
MDVKINILELASELAELEMVEKYADSIEIYSDEDDDCIVYTDSAQLLFNELYDKYYSLIEKIAY